MRKAPVYRFELYGRYQILWTDIRLFINIRLEIAHNFMDLCKVWPYRWRSSWHAHYQFFFPVNVLNTYFFICKILYLQTCSAVESWTALFESGPLNIYPSRESFSAISLYMWCFFLQPEAAPHKKLFLAVIPKLSIFRGKGRFFEITLKKLIFV